MIAAVLVMAGVWLVLHGTTLLSWSLAPPRVEAQLADAVAGCDRARAAMRRRSLAPWS